MRLGRSFHYAIANWPGSHFLDRTYLGTYIGSSTSLIKRGCVFLPPTISLKSKDAQFINLSVDPSPTSRGATAAANKAAKWPK